MEVLDRDSQRGVKGGLTAAELLADIAANGIDKYVGKTYAFDGGGQNGFSYISNTYYGGVLPEVVVTASPTGNSGGGSTSSVWSSFSSGSNWSNAGSFGSNSYYAGGVSDIGGGGNNGIEKALFLLGLSNDFMDASGKVSMVSTGKAIGQFTVPAGFVIGATQILIAYNKDGFAFGYNSQKASAAFGGSLVGAWAGFEVGAAVGFESGFLIGAAFGGIGAIPGAVAGGVLGGFGGALGGGYYGGQIAEGLIEK